MKKLYILALGLVLLAAPTISRADKTFTISNLLWNGSTFIPDCSSPGDNCTITITVPGIAVRDDGNGNWLVSGNISQPQVNVQAHPPMFRPVGGYVFPVGSGFQIQQGEFPGVPAMYVNLSGVQTDANGNWQVLIPKG